MNEKNNKLVLQKSSNPDRQAYLDKLPTKSQIRAEYEIAKKRRT